MAETFKYYAFISYSSHDVAWGKRLQRKLEGFRLPATVCSERGLERKPMKPVFFAPTDIQPGPLSAELQERLRASRNLIVIGSPHSARSEWVGREIEYFHSLGRAENIHYFIIDGKPNSGDPETECFNPVIEELGMPEILGANIHEQNHRLPWLNRQRAEIQLISKLLGIEFDTLWQREKRRVRTRIALWALGLIAVAAIVAAVWLGGRPVDVNVSLSEVTVHNQNLPDTTAIVTLMLDNEVKCDTLPSVTQAACFANVPHDFVGKEVRLTFNSYGWIPLDTVVKLDKSLTLNINRDPEVWGMVNFTLKNETTDRYMPNAELIVGGRKVKSDSEGRVKLVFPLPDQRRSYPLQADFPLADTVIYPDNETTGAIVTAYPTSAPTTIELVD